MRIKELIKELQEYNGDIEIEVINSYWSREKLDDVLCERNVKKQKDTVILLTDSIEKNIDKTN
jgi:hypothetical protein